ncbi:type II secretion system F family protein [Patescibacteria group bacterium]|nr:type II secretion system F family protein [Patescibacteria group bacterium]MBU1871087.1 type II secretion system F family protein [Patescibacteria group bacterium]
MTINLPQTNNQSNKIVLTKNNSNTLASKIKKISTKFSSIPLSEKLFFIQHLSIMLKVGISLLVCLKTLEKQTSNKKFSEIINDISSNVEKGTTFTESLKPHEKIFGQLFINMIESGEISGKLEEVLQQLYIQFKKQHELISKIKGALIYPVVLVVAIIGIGAFMMLVVVPQITSIFKELNTELPLPTKLLIGFSDTLIQHSILFSVSLIIFIILFIKILKTHRGKFIFQKLLLKTPICSPIIKKINLARFARTMSSLLKTDIMIIKSFQITANVINNLHYRNALKEIANKVKKGGKISDAVRNYPDLFSQIVIQMITIGEKTGELDYILDELAQFYENEVDQTMSNLPAIIEPILILFLGIIVGGMAIAIIMPMYSLSSVI